MPTTKTITIPDGYTEAVLLFPNGRAQAAIDTFAELGSYDPTQHGSTATLKAEFARKSMAAFIDQQVTQRDVRIAIANATAANKITAL